MFVSKLGNIQTFLI